MNYMIVQITPPAIENIGYRTYIIFAVLNATWVPVIYLFFPETKGLELEDVDRLFEKGGGRWGRGSEMVRNEGSEVGSEDKFVGRMRVGDGLGEGTRRIEV